MLMLSLALLVLLMTNTARAVTAGSAQSGLGSSFVSEIFNTYGSPPAARGDTAPASSSRARSRMSGAVPLADTPAKQSRSTRTHAVAALRSLPEVGFSDEPAASWLGAIQAGLKTHELRLDTHPATASLGPGDSFVAQSPYRALEVRIVRVTTFPDFESAWLAHGTSLVPHAVRAVRTAAEARSVFQSFYNHTVNPMSCDAALAASRRGSAARTVGARAPLASGPRHLTPQTILNKSPSLVRTGDRARAGLLRSYCVRCVFPPGSNCPCSASGSGLRPR